jgi:DNA ligase-3
LIVRASPQRVMRDGLEGLVLKAIDGVYEPGKRHWLKLKKYGWSALTRNVFQRLTLLLLVLQRLSEPRRHGRYSRPRGARYVGDVLHIHFSVSITSPRMSAGAYFGKGKNGGDMTIFLMGCYDPVVSLWNALG